MKNPAREPAASHAEASERIARSLAQDSADIDPVCRSIFLDQGSRAEKSIVLFHGYTNSPRQFGRLGKLFFERGYNVYIPRAPFHGLADRMTEATAGLTAEGLVAYASSAVDIAVGLGEKVTVAGLSMGGVLALWAGMHRPELALAVPIAPALAFHAIPLRLTKVISTAMLVLPNRFNWWDPSAEGAPPQPPLHAYPRYSSRGLAQFVAIGSALRAESKREMPAAGKLLFVVNQADEAVDNRFAEEIFRRWIDAGADKVAYYEFEAERGLIHDLIDPEQPKQQVDFVYPRLLELMDS